MNTTPLCITSVLLASAFAAQTSTVPVGKKPAISTAEDKNMSLLDEAFRKLSDANSQDDGVADKKLKDLPKETNVDNGEKDAPIGTVREEMPTIKLEELPENFKFSLEKLPDATDSLTVPKQLLGNVESKKAIKKSAPSIPAKGEKLKGTDTVIKSEAVVDPNAGDSRPAVALSNRELEEREKAANVTTDEPTPGGLKEQESLENQVAEAAKEAEKSGTSPKPAETGNKPPAIKEEPKKFNGHISSSISSSSRSSSSSSTVASSSKSSSSSSSKHLSSSSSSSSWSKHSEEAEAIAAPRRLQTSDQPEASAEPAKVATPPAQEPNQNDASTVTLSFSAVLGLATLLLI